MNWINTALALARLTAPRADDAWTDDAWCVTCGVHRSLVAGGLCPGCAADAPKAAS